MKTTALLSSFLLAASMVSSSVLAQENAPAPAPASAAPLAPVTLNGVVAVEKLPTPTSLLKDAEAEGLTILRMEQTPDRMIVVYQYPDGSTRAFAYTTTVEVAAATPVRAAALSTATYTVVAEPAPAPRVVYAQPETIYYTQREPVYYSPRYIRAYDPAWDFWTPLAVGVGLGWGFGGHQSHGGSYGHGGHSAWHGGHGAHRGGHR